MHPNSRAIVSRLVTEHIKSNRPLRVLDVGSYNVNGTYKDMFPSPSFLYQGLDCSPGPNVDLVVDKDYLWKDIPRNHYDVVVCGQVLEHVTEPWTMVKLLGEVCVKGGLVIVVVPWMCGVHEFPLDCWRILPDGLDHIMGKYGGFDRISSGMQETDTYYLGKRR